VIGMREENPCAWLIIGSKAAPTEFRSAPPGRSCIGPANPELRPLRRTLPWAIFVFSLRETGARVLQQETGSRVFRRETGPLRSLPFNDSTPGDWR